MPCGLFLGSKSATHSQLKAHHTGIWPQDREEFKQHIICIQVGRTVNRISKEYMTWPKILKVVCTKLAGPGGNELFAYGGEKKWVLFCALGEQTVRSLSLVFAVQMTRCGCIASVQRSSKYLWACTQTAPTKESQDGS